MTRHDSGSISHIHQELHSHLPSEPALRVKALESLLVEKGMVNPKTVDAWIEVYSNEIGPKRGAQVVARAWVDLQFTISSCARSAPAIQYDYLVYRRTGTRRRPTVREPYATREVFSRNSALA